MKFSDEREIVSDLLVIGLGYVGMPLAQAAVHAGLKVVGFDINEAVVAGLREGRSHIDDLTDADVKAMLDRGFSATNDEEAIAQADAVVICVPTPLSEGGGPELSAVIAAVDVVHRNLALGTLVVLESTTYPGTTEEVVRPTLEDGHRVVGRDFFLSFSPERVDPGNAHFGIRNTPKVVGGTTPACTERAVALYSQFIDTVVEAVGTREAETAKLLENTYRHINIALVNEMARFCHELGIDLWDVIRLASTKPFGFQAFYPGPGVGGHCIPIDPNYLSYSVRTRLGYPFRFVELAQEINATMPRYVASRAQAVLNDASMATKGARILLVGVTYKPDIADRRESPAVGLAKALKELGAQLSYADPYVESWRVEGTDVARVIDPVAEAGLFDLVILVQNHRVLDIPALSTMAVRLLDTRGVAEGSSVTRL